MFWIDNKKLILCIYDIYKHNQYFLGYFYKYCTVILLKTEIKVFSIILIRVIIIQRSVGTDAKKKKKKFNDMNNKWKKITVSALGFTKIIIICVWLLDIRFKRRSTKCKLLNQKLALLIVVLSTFYFLLINFGQICQLHPLQRSKTNSPPIQSPK